MKTQEKSKQNLEFLSSLCDDKTPFKIRFALNSLMTSKTHKILDKFLLFIEYSQLMSQLMLLLGLGSGVKARLSLAPLLCSLIAVFTPGYLLGRHGNTNHSSLSINYIIPLLCYFLLKYSLGAYIAMICKRTDYRKPRTLVTIWKIVVKLQSRVLYYIVGSFLVELAMSGLRGENSKLFGIISGELVGVLAIILLVVEFSFSVMITRYFVYMLPSSGIYLAAKSPTTETLTLIQKFALHIMMISIDSVTQQTSWVVIVVQVLFCAIRNGHFFYTLPLYDLSALIFQGSLLMMMKSLTLAYFLQIAIKSIEIEDNFVWIVWIIFSILSTKISHAYLKNTTINLLFNGDKKIKAAGLLMNKIILIRQILKNDKKATQICSHYDWSHLFSKTISLYSTQIFGATASSSKLDFQDPNLKELVKKAIAAYLEENLKNFPRSNTLKLFTGYYFAKKLKLYELGIKFLREAQDSSSFVVSLNSFLVLNTCQEELIKTSKDPEKAFDMDTYSRSRSIVAKLQLGIIRQAELQEELYQEMTQNSVNLGKIYQISQVIKKQRENVKRIISNTLETIPEYYTDPLLICAHYFACLNFDFEGSKMYQNLFSRRFSKYEKQFGDMMLCNENLYQRKNDFLVASSEKASTGITLYNSKTFTETRGRDLKGVHFSMGLMPIFTNEIMQITKLRVETGDRETKGKVMPYFIYHLKNGFISPTFSFADTNPYLGNGAQDLMFSRPVSVPFEYFVLSEDGKVEYYTARLAKALDLDTKPDGASVKKHEIHVRQICQELEKINQAFNVIAFPEKYNKESEAQEIYNQYTTTGKPHQFQSLNLMREITYHCKIQNVIFGRLFVKFVTLEKLTDQPDYETPRILSSAKNEEDVESDIDKDHEIVQIPTTYPREKINLISSTLKTTSQTENPLSTERESAAFLLTTQRNQSSPLKLKQIEKIQSTEEGDFEPNHHKSPRRSERLQTKTTNHTQKQADRFEVNTAYKLAVNAKYYAPRYRLITIFMYLLFTFLLIYQAISKVVNNSDIGDLDGQGQALLLLEQRSNDILWAHGRVTLIWEFISDFQDQTIFPPYLKMPLVAIGARDYAQIFTLSNKNILSKTHFLPDDLQNEFFKPKIKYYEDPNDMNLYTNLNFFQSLDRLSETLLNAIDLAVADLPTAVNMSKIYLNNDVNDILAENDYLFEQVQDSVNFLGDQIKREGYFYLIVMIPLICLVGIGLFAFMVDQYCKDKQNLFIITKVNHHQVHNIRNKISHFKNLLIQEEDIAAIDIEETYYRSRFDNAVNKYSKEQWSGNKETSSQRETKLGHLIKSYLLQSSKLLVIWILLISFTFINYQLRRHTLDATRDSIDQLAQIYKVRNKAVFPFVCITEVLIQNSTSNILNVPSQETFMTSIAQLRELVTNLPALFPSNDDSIDPAIIESLYQDSCRYLNAVDKEFCRQTNKGSNSVGLLQLMVNYASSFDVLYERYKISDKTQSSLARLQIEGFNSGIVPMLNAIASTCEFIQDALTINYQETLDSGYQSNNVNLAVISVILCIGCLIIHFSVIKTLKEAENRFRNILQTLPSGVSLSNFLIKAYLLRTSADALNSVKNRI